MAQVNHMTADAKSELLEFIADTERRLFRTNQDTGANTNALMVWNCLREFAGMERLTRDELRQRHVDTSDNVDSVDDLIKYEAWYRDYSVWRDFPSMEKRYREIEAAGGWEYLVGKAKGKKAT